MDFPGLIAPIDEQLFLDRYWDREPVHIPANTGRGQLPIGWNDLNALLRQRPLWTADRFKLILNSRPVEPAHYMVGIPGRDESGDPALIEQFLAMGASLVLNHVEDLLPRARAITDALTARFAGTVGANCYASFKGIQAFASHFDAHEVFAVQCDGEKLWRIYANRADAPLESPAGEGVQARIDASKGPVAFEVTMRPGDVLYIPRGFFHDAIATDTVSLHLTFGIAPPSGQLLLQVIEDLALNDPAFRAYLPDARMRGGAPLREVLADLGRRLATLSASPTAFDAVALRQRKLLHPQHGLMLPARPSLHFFARSRRSAQVERDEDGAWLTGFGQREPLGLLGDTAEWMLQRPAFSREEICARFPWHPAGEIDALMATFERAGLIEPYQPQT